MTFKDLRNDVGSKINQYSKDSDSFVSGFVTTTEVDRWINQAFQDVYKWYALANRGIFLTTATLDTVKDQAIYTFGGDASDILAISSVGIMYKSTDSFYTRVKPGKESDLIQYGNETFPKHSPLFFEETIYNTTTGHYVKAIEFPEDCIPDKAVTKGIEVKYVARPPKLEDNLDIPEKLPDEVHRTIVLGAVIPCFEKMGEWDVAAQLENKFNAAIKAFFVQDQTQTAKGIKKIRMRRQDVNKFFRRDS